MQHTPIVIGGIEQLKVNPGLGYEDTTRMRMHITGVYSG